jgi:hypothetical protein
VIWALLACTTQTDSGDTPPAPVTPELTLSVELTQPLVAVASVTSNWDATPWIELQSAQVGPLRTRSAPVGQDHRVVVPGMRQASDYTLVAVALDADGARVESAPQVVTTGTVDMTGLAEWTVHTGADVNDGVITLFAPNIVPWDRGPYIWGVDRAGELVWAFEPDWTQDLPGTRAPRMGADGSFSLLREDGVYTVSAEGVVTRTLPLDVAWNAHHDAVPLADGQALVLAETQAQMQVPGVDEPVAVTVDTLLWMDAAGEPLWQWSAVDALDNGFFPTPESKSPGVEGPVEWTHGNSLEVYGDTALLSLRHHSQAVLIDLTTGEALWRFGRNGDFELLSGEWFDLQHAVMFQDDDTVLLYDNGNGTGSGSSRMVAYDIDTTAMTATQVRSWDVGFHTANMGDVDALDGGGVLIAAAGKRAAEVNGHLFELDADDQVVWDVEILTRVETFATEQAYWLTPVE